MDLLSVAVLGHKVPPLSYLSDFTKPGDLVLIPIRDRVAYGIVIDQGMEKRRLRRVKKVIAKGFVSSKFLDLMKWISDYYLTPIEDVVRMAVPRSILPRVDISPQIVRETEPGPRLNRWQRNAVDEIGYKVKKKTYGVHLLYGITGSGKTEVYINLILESLRMGMAAIVLYPEIALTPLYQQRFERRFSAAVLHSGLSAKNRRKNWHALRNGSCSVAIGPRSAIFAPLKGIGVIIVDEEHSPSYKEGFRAPRYHAREVAIARAKIEGCPVILGSATPSIDTYHKAVIGDYRLVKLPERIKARPLPEVRIIDLRKEKERVFTNQLLIELKKTVKNKSQAIIFINRKGYAPVVICKDCGYSRTCPDCGIPLVYYRRRKLLRCPYCNHQEPIVERCPRCHGKNIGLLGTGTEQIEERLTKMFGQHMVLRVDRDQVRRELYKIYTQFQNRDRLMMVGTSIVTKGHDFPFVTMVGVINGDQILNFPDFRASEFTFQTLTQVAGRAGRGKTPGRVIIQTYRPDHPVFRSIKDHNFQTFYKEEIAARKGLNYPPFSRIILIRFSGPRLESLLSAGEKIKKAIPRKKGTAVLGPAEAFRRKVGQNFNVVLLIKINGDHKWLKKIARLKFDGLRMIIDVDPVSVA